RGQQLGRARRRVRPGQGRLVEGPWGAVDQPHGGQPALQSDQRHPHPGSGEGLLWNRVGDHVDRRHHPYGTRSDPMLSTRCSPHALAVTLEAGACGREHVQQVTEWLAAPDLAAARWLFTRALAAAAAVAFGNALLQFRPLLGAGGLLPVPRYLQRVSFRQQPSVFHLRYSDRLAAGVAAGGLGLSLLLLAGVPQRLSSLAVLLTWLLVYALYLSIVNVGQIWYAFGWESILLEAGFFAAF